MRDRVFRVTGKRNPTTRDFIEVTRRGTFHDHPRFIGSPKDVADGMEEWFGGPRLRRLRGGRVARARRIRGFRADWWCRNCNDAGMLPQGLRRRRRCARTWACRARRSAPGAVSRYHCHPGGTQHEAVLCTRRLLARHPCAAGGNRQAVRRLARQPAEGAQYKPGFTSVNPKSKVPTLERDDGSVLTEFPAIAYWLARTNPARETAARGRRSPGARDGGDGLRRLHHAHAGLHAIFRPGNFSPNAADEDAVKARGKEIFEKGLAMHGQGAGRQGVHRRAVLDRRRGGVLCRVLGAQRR